MSHQPPESHKLRRRLILASVLTGGTFFVAHSINSVVASSIAYSAPAVRMNGPAGSEVAEASLGSKQQLVKDILASSLFPLPPPPAVSTGPGGPAGVNAVPLNVATKVSLIGVVMGAAGDARAIIEDLASKKQSLYRLSDRIPNVGELAAIERDRVLFREGVQEEWLEGEIAKLRATIKPFVRQQELQPAPVLIPVAAPVAVPARPGRQIVERARLVHLAASPENYFNEARVRPHFGQGDRSDGLIIDGIRQAGVLEQTGLQNDDVVTGINGVAVQDPGQLWEMVKQLQHERRARMNVLRQGNPTVLTMEIR